MSVSSPSISALIASGILLVYSRYSSGRQGFSLAFRAYGVSTSGSVGSSVGPVVHLVVRLVHLVVHLVRLVHRVVHLVRMVHLVRLVRLVVGG